jgi:hypothetical protein
MWLEPGRWQPSAEERDHRGHLGLLIVDGFAARTLQLGARRGVEILGPGDVLRPWVRLVDYSSVPVDEGWDVLEPTRLAGASTWRCGISPTCGGHVGRDGVELRLNLTHALIADLVAAERPSVSLALTALRDRGLVERDGDDVWHLHGPPPGELDEVRAQATGPLR